MDVLLVFLAATLGYVYMRTSGSKKPANIKLGTRDRIISGLVVAAIAAAIMNMFFHQKPDDRWGVVVIPVILGALVVLLPYLSKDKEKK